MDLVRELVAIAVLVGGCASRWTIPQNTVGPPLMCTPVATWVTISLGFSRASRCWMGRNSCSSRTENALGRLTLASIASLLLDAWLLVVPCRHFR